MPENTCGHTCEHFERLQLVPRISRCNAGEGSVFEGDACKAPEKFKAVVAKILEGIGGEKVPEEKA